MAFRCDRPLRVRGQTPPPRPANLPVEVLILTSSDPKPHRRFGIFQPTLTGEPASRRPRSPGIVVRSSPDSSVSSSGAFETGTSRSGVPLVKLTSSELLTRTALGGTELSDAGTRFLVGLNPSISPVPSQAFPSGLLRLSPGKRKPPDFYRESGCEKVCRLGWHVRPNLLTNEPPPSVSFIPLRENGVEPSRLGLPRFKQDGVPLLMLTRTLK